MTIEQNEENNIGENEKFNREREIKTSGAEEYNEWNKNTHIRIWRTNWIKEKKESVYSRKQEVWDHLVRREKRKKVNEKEWETTTWFMEYHQKNQFMNY